MAPAFPSKQDFLRNGLRAANASEVSGQTCSICMDPFRSSANPSGEEPVVLPCNHPFGRPCITHWLDEHTTCPVCRLELFPQRRRNTVNDPFPYGMPDDIGNQFHVHPMGGRNGGGGGWGGSGIGSSRPSHHDFIDEFDPHDPGFMDAIMGIDRSAPRGTRSRGTGGISPPRVGFDDDPTGLDEYTHDGRRNGYSPPRVVYDDDYTPRHRGPNDPSGRMGGRRTGAFASSQGGFASSQRGHAVASSTRDGYGRRQEYTYDDTTGGARTQGNRAGGGTTRDDYGRRRNTGDNIGSYGLSERYGTGRTRSDQPPRDNYEPGGGFPNFRAWENFDPWAPDSVVPGSSRRDGGGCRGGVCSSRTEPSSSGPRATRESGSAFPGRGQRMGEYLGGRDRDMYNDRADGSRHSRDTYRDSGQGRGSSSRRGRPEDYFFDF
ncbi:hypothetical protein P154DRAFT_566716 [Amniculicola lignicola CBS 123094]|uniref:RING-type domain-containing protein n=1 Tax=Amniculicola lignicola CBS 123094 TaxID=1392246 RepID=A0A6A5WCR7_9PLEO|nr:hypothetical protein P154DRAFT_566716 [Amniculicola lignicola CBS 123094]